jgi:aspartate/methionine/tyrosine aminotransferase
MPIEIEAPEWIGYENIECNLSESAFADQRLSSLNISLDDLVLHYGDHMGKRELRKIIAADAGVTPEEVLITPGAATALFIIATALLNKGDHLVVTKPNYATNIETPRTLEADISFLQLQFEEQFSLDIEQLQNLVTPATKLVSITYPHNPTGAMIDEPTLHRIIDVVEQRSCYLLVDETYREMVFGKQLPVAASLSNKMISVSSMSKAYGLPGIRIGWLVCKDAELMKTFLAAKEQIIITNSVTDEEIAYRYLLQKETLFEPVKKTIVQNFGLVNSFMQQQDVLEWVPPQGGCVCFPRINKSVDLDMDKFYEVLLHKYKTYTGRGHWFEEDKRYLRIGFGWETAEKLEKGLNNILQAVEETKVG